MTRSVVTLKVLIFWSSDRLFTRQTNIFIIELDKKIFLPPSILRKPYVFWSQS